MNEISNIYSNLKNYEIKVNTKKLIKSNTENNIKEKSVYKLDKEKRESNVKENNNKKNFSSIKEFNCNVNVQKKIYCKKRANSFYDIEKKPSNKETIVNNNNKNNKISKKQISRNKKFLFYNYSTNNKLRKKIMLNDRNNSNDNINKKCINNVEISYIEPQKYKNIYFNTILNDGNINIKRNEEAYISLSQSFGKNNNILKKINSTEIYNNDNFNNKYVNEADKEYESNSNNYSKFYLKNPKYSFDTNNFYIKDFSDSNFNKKEDNYDNDSYYPKNEGEILNNNTHNKYKPIKLINDNTTINLAGSYNFHQYFNTIISSKNNYNINNSYQKNKKKSFYNNSPLNNNRLITHIINKNNDKNIYFNTQLNSNEKKTKNSMNNIFSNEKLLKEINDINDEMNQNLKKNPTNSKSRKYNTLKHSFEKLLKIINNYFYNSNELNHFFDFLQNIFIGYHEVVSAFSSENIKLKELNYKLTEQYEKIDKKLIESKKIIKEKQKTIEMLENKLNGLIINMKNKNVIREYHINMKEFDLKKNSEDHYNKIKKINEKNLDDLDALYFFDKIETKPKRTFSGGKLVPILPINIRK